MPKISILMPTYNDEKYIVNALDSIMMQTYKDYEVLICNDGSTDKTKEVIYEYKDKNDKEDKIHYYYEDNADQLNAIITLIPYIKGKYVYILHSDDMLYDKDTLKKMITYMDNNHRVDSIIADIALIDKDNKIIGNSKVTDYKYNDYHDIIALQLLWLGRNLYVDMAFHKKEVFIKKVYDNYLLWNGPFWLNIDKNNILNFKKVNFSFFKYRLGDNNYLNMEGSKLNVINGEIRVVTIFLKNYYIPNYKLQYILYRVCNKLKLGKYYKIFYKKKETLNKYEIIKFVLNKRFTDEEIENNIFLNSLLSFYKNYTERKINIEISSDDIIYYGKDMRLFNKKIVNNNIEELYNKIMIEMNTGFNEIVINKKEDYENVLNITKFLCIYPYVKITVKEE